MMQNNTSGLWRTQGQGRRGGRGCWGHPPQRSLAQGPRWPRGSPSHCTVCHRLPTGFVSSGRQVPAPSL